MADVDPCATQQDLIPELAVELCSAGFDDVEVSGWSTAALSLRWTVGWRSKS